MSEEEDEQRKRDAAERQRMHCRNKSAAECNWKNMIDNDMDGHNGATVQKLIDAGADVNAQDTLGWTALMVTARYGGEHAAGTMRVLVDAGADANKQNEDGWTALMHTAERGGKHGAGMMRLLVDAALFLPRVASWYSRARGK